MAMHILHLTASTPNCRATQRGMVMKIEVEDAADGSKRRRIMHSNALGAIMQVHVEDAADGSKRRRITHANTRTRSSPVPNNVLTPMLVGEQRRQQSRLPTMTQGVQQRDAKSTCTHHNVKHDIDRSTSTSYCCGSYCRSAHVKCGCRHTRQKGEATKKTT